MRRHDDSDSDQTEHRVSDMSRRGFLQSGSAAVGGSLLGAGLTDQASTSASASTSPSAAADFAAVRQNWLDMLLGYNPDGSNTYIDTRITQLENITSNLQSNINTTDSNRVFDNLNLDDGAGATLGRLRLMAKAYKNPLTSYYDDTSVRDDVIDGMKLIYNEGYWSDSSTVDGWFDQIKTPWNAVELTILMYDDLSPTWRSNYAAAVQHHNDFLSVANNKRDSDVARSSYTQLGIAAIDEDAELLEKATEYPENAVYTTDPPGSGHYPDGSYLDHTDHPYTNGSYGTRVLRNLPRILEVVDGTQWDDVSWANNLYEIAGQAYIGALYDGTSLNAFFGRDLSRGGIDITVYSNSAEHLHYILRLAQSAPDGVARELRELVKYHVQAPDSVDFRQRGANGRPFISAIELMNDVMTDDTLSATREAYSPKVFDNADRQVVKTDDFAAEISGYSSRIATYEGSHGEHRKGWHTGRGMTLLHTSDEQQFVENMWPTIDWYRLPGTTVVNKDLRPQAYESERSTEDWVGGSNLDNVGAFGMSMGPEYTDMSGTKSWLTLGDQIVCLGTDITNTDEGGPTETTLINRKLNAAGDNSFVVDGSSQPTSLDWSDTVSDPSWAWLEDTGGYYFPDASDYQAKREQRSGTWKDINVTYNEGETTHSNNFLTLWQDHGTAPSDASYQYVLLPERTQSETEAYANDPPLDIEKHTSDVQAVRNADHYAANFWEPASAGEVTSHNPASVVLEIDRENADSQSDDYPHTLSIAVADPTQEQDSLRVEIDRNVDASSVDHPRVTVVNDINPFIFDVDLSEAYGDDITIDLPANIGGDPRRRPTLSFDENAYVTAGESREFPTTLENAQPEPLTNLEFDLEVPDSWEVELARVEGPASQSGSLPGGETATAVWNVRPPEGATLDAYDITASSSYEYDGFWAGPRSLEETLSVDWTDETLFEMPDEQTLVLEKTGEITATMTNPFPFDLEDVAATLTPPNDPDEWTIEPVSATVDVLSPGESVEFTWEVTPADWLPGTYDVELAVEYVRTNDSNSFVQTATVTTALEGNDGVTPTSSATGTTSTDADGPGFGVGGAVAGLGGAGYLLHRRLAGTDAESATDEDA